MGTDLTYLDGSGDLHHSVWSWPDVCSEMQGLGMIIDGDVRDADFPSPPDYGITNDEKWAAYDACFKDAWDLIHPDELKPDVPHWVRDYHRAKFAAMTWTVPRPSGIHEHKLSAFNGEQIITPAEIRGALAHYEVQVQRGYQPEDWFVQFIDFMRRGIKSGGIVVS